MANNRRLVSTPVEYVRRLGSSVMDYVFGHDVFISYTHRDAKPYAGKLRDELQGSCGVLRARPDCGSCRTFLHMIETMQATW